MGGKKSVGISSLEEDILTCLENRTLYGLEILDILNNGRQKPIGFGSLYPTLGRLEGKRLVTWKWGEEKNGGARRKYYQISPDGLKALRLVQEYRESLKLRI